MASSMLVERRCIQGFVGKPAERRPLGKPRRRWEDNIKMELQDVGWGAWTGLKWLRIGTRQAPGKAVMNLRVP